ncbi:methyltransferase domain-containing protein [uncultured Thiohalocapsa sp.]|mgnify:CR=1 FL=1|uniref:class I SAM-dependent methyltransferase n=1 Tax=uncultured Thiohalocapsa sp. TaxID=768990 RepID=UPI0025DF073C|nr:methyltransferase domain-containing protein [uncultured Thiohalocapsa sp.]
MTNYYEELYDIDFFSGPVYAARVEGVSVDVAVTGPVWESWASRETTVSAARRAFTELAEAACAADATRALRCVTSEVDRALLLLVATEDAYRCWEQSRLCWLLRLLWASEFPDTRLKARKLCAAWAALRDLDACLTPTCVHAAFPGHDAAHPLCRLVGEAVDFCNTHDGERYTHSDVKVERPVREAWERGGFDIRVPADVEHFYRTTYAYVLELTAANFQVQTLFNYHEVLSHLRLLGVRQIFDYGAGIGTFLALAARQGFGGTYADLPSSTSAFAQRMLSACAADVVIAELDYQETRLASDLDCILCTEVMEHVFEPERLVEAFHSSLRPGGVFVVSESFDYTEEFCTHLPWHKGKGGQHFIEFLRKTGFAQVHTPFTIHPTLHVKVA